MAVEYEWNENFSLGKKSSTESIGHSAMRKMRASLNLRAVNFDGDDDLNVADDELSKLSRVRTKLTMRRTAKNRGNFAQPAVPTRADSAPASITHDADVLRTNKPKVRFFLFQHTASSSRERGME
mmetsp:Transcript_6634/g.14173  ORF Transcript_6634/g.14173 Transcript_6634/m.14173 type:complete len:125 (+) Transcript_6634:220-594(+)